METTTPKHRGSLVDGTRTSLYYKPTHRAELTIHAVRGGAALKALCGERLGVRGDVRHTGHYPPLIPYADEHVCRTCRVRSFAVRVVGR